MGILPRHAAEIEAEERDADLGALMGEALTIRAELDRLNAIPGGVPDDEMARAFDRDHESRAALGDALRRLGHGAARVGDHVLIDLDAFDRDHVIRTSDAPVLALKVSDIEGFEAAATAHDPTGGASRSTWDAQETACLCLAGALDFWLGVEQLDASPVPNAIVGRQLAAAGAVRQALADLREFLAKSGAAVPAPTFTFPEGDVLPWPCVLKRGGRLVILDRYGASHSLPLGEVLDLDLGDEDEAEGGDS